MKELEITFSIRNNRLKERREAAGFGVCKLAEKLGISIQVYIRLEKMSPKQPLFYRRPHRGYAIGDWIEPIQKLARFYDVDPSELFPNSVLLVEANNVTKKVDCEEVPALLAGACDHLQLPEDTSNPELLLMAKERNEYVLEALDTLDERERAVLENRLGGELLRDADPNGKTRERARQLERRAIDKLRRRVREIEGG